MKYDKIELIVQDSESGTIYDVSEIAGKIETSKAIDSSAGSITFSLTTNQNDLYFNMGSTVTFKVYQDNAWHNKFFGYVFLAKPNIDTLEITAYDQLKYLMNEETYVLTDLTHEQVIAVIGADFNLRIGTVEGENYILPERIEDGSALGDTIQQSLDYTLIGTGNYYIIRDEFGYLCCRNVANLVTNIVVSETSLLRNFEFEESIGSDTYNKIKLYRDNEETGKRETYIAQDSSTMSKWGILQKYESVDESMNSTQIGTRATDMLTLYNKPTKKLSLEINGVLQLEAGSGIYLNLSQIPDKLTNELFLIKKIDDTYDNGLHSSKIEVVYE